MSIPQFAQEPSDCALRSQAIQYALSSGATGDTVLEMAEKYYEFLTGGKGDSVPSS